MDQFEAYVICTSPRSGSTLLCKLLHNTGIAGNPDSHFHDPSLSKWLGYYGLEPEKYTQQKNSLSAVFDAACKFGKGDTGIFGLRLQRHSFDFFMQQLRILYPQLPNEKACIEALFGKTLFIHLTRENKLEQAISYVRAKQSGLWHMAPDGTELERLSEPMKPSYDAQAISKQLALSVNMDEEWKAWFATEQIEPLCVTYEELSADPHGTLAQILKTLGVSYELTDDSTLPVAKLADAINIDWAERFAAEKPDPNS